MGTPGERAGGSKRLRGRYVPATSARSDGLDEPFRFIWTAPTTKIIRITHSVDVASAAERKPRGEFHSARVKPVRSGAVKLAIGGNYGTLEVG